MPRPLSSLGPDEHRVYADLAARPLDPFTPQLLADLADDHKHERRAALLREQHRLALLELLRGAALDEAECARLARDLASSPQEPAAAERQLSAALGTATRGEVMLQLLEPEGNLDSQKLAEQYEFQKALLASLGLLQGQNGKLGITAIDGRFHPVPALAGIQKRLQTPALRQKVAQGFNQVLLVPFGLPLERLLEAWRQCLRRNEHLLQEIGGLDRDEPVWLWGQAYGRQDGRGPDEDGRLVYRAQRFARDHGGRTKAKLLASGHGGWDVLLTEGSLAEIPPGGQGQTVCGRPQLECGRSPEDYLAALCPGEVGWTPETYVLACCTQLECMGRVPDAETLTYLLGSYLPASGRVPGAYWRPDFRQAGLVGDLPGWGYPGNGARAAVRAFEV